MTYQSCCSPSRQVALQTRREADTARCGPASLSLVPLAALSSRRLHHRGWASKRRRVAAAHACPPFFSSPPLFLTPHLDLGAGAQSSSASTRRQRSGRSAARAMCVCWRTSRAPRCASSCVVTRRSRCARTTMVSASWNARKVVKERETWEGGGAAEGSVGPRGGGEIQRTRHAAGSC